MFKTLKLEMYAGGIMWIMTKSLGLDENNVIGNFIESEGRLILEEYSIRAPSQRVHCAQ